MDGPKIKLLNLLGWGQDRLKGAGWRVLTTYCLESGAVFLKCEIKTAESHSLGLFCFPRCQCSGIILFGFVFILRQILLLSESLLAIWLC